MNVRHWYRNGAGYNIAFDYDVVVIELLKTKIPHTHRSWDADKKEWWINDEYINELDKIFKGFSEMVKSQSVMDLRI